MSPNEDDHLTPEELDAWPAMVPPAGFADRVMAARDAVPVAPKRHNRTLLAGFGVAVAAAAIALLVATRGASQASDGALHATARTTERLGERATVVAEASADLNWHVSASGDAEVTQSTGDVFYRIEHGGEFVVHTPAGDVRVTGTCFRIEVSPVNKTQQILVSGAIGAAIATGVVVTVYEGRVVADTRSGKTELVAGSRAELTKDGTVVVASADSPASGSAAIAMRAKNDELIHLRTRVASLETELAEKKSGSGAEAKGRHGGHDDEPDDGHLWHDPSPERLQEFAKQCRIRYDMPSIDHWGARSLDDLSKRGVVQAELGPYNDAFGEVSKQWIAVVRALYIEATNDTQGAETLSLEAMRNEIVEKAQPEEYQLVLQKISRERAGLQPAPTSTVGMSPLERLIRAQSSLGDDAERALARRIGADRAHEIRGDQWDGAHEHSGCPKVSP